MEQYLPLLTNAFSDPNMIIRFAVLYLCVIWISVVIWVIKDITNRSDNLFLQVISVLMVLVFTPLGIFVYLLIRPQSTLFERLYEREFRDLATRYEEPVEASEAQKKIQDQLNKQVEKKTGKK